jgi:hypothetical protein
MRAEARPVDQRPRAAARWALRCSINSPLAQINAYVQSSAVKRAGLDKRIEDLRRRVAELKPEVSPAVPLVQNHCSLTCAGRPRHRWRI